MSSRSSLPSHAHSSDTMDIFLLMRRSHQYLPTARLNAAARRPMFVAKARRYLGASSLWKIWAPYMAPMLALIAILVVVSQSLPRVVRFADSKGAFEHTLPSQVTVLPSPGTRVPSMLRSKDVKTKRRSESRRRQSSARHGSTVR